MQKIKKSLLERLLKEQLNEFKILREINKRGSSACFIIENKKNHQIFFLRILVALSNLNIKSFISYNDNVFIFLLIRLHAILNQNIL